MANTDPTKCHNDCYYQILAIQARTRLNLANCIMTSIHSLLSTERFLKDFKMPGWAPLNESIVKKQIKISDKASKKRASDLHFCVEMIKQGCKICRDKDTALHQVIQQSASENQSDYDLQMDFALQILKEL